MNLGRKVTAAMITPCHRGAGDDSAIRKRPSIHRHFCGHYADSFLGEFTEGTKKPNHFNRLYGGRARARTVDPLIKSQLLYQLSYAPPCPADIA
jgi:hypothetical protein